MPVDVIWKFTFPAGKNYWAKTECKEEVVYINFYGDNRSHEGRTYSGWHEVKPVEKEITAYVKV